LAIRYVPAAQSLKAASTEPPIRWSTRLSRQEFEKARKERRKVLSRCIGRERSCNVGCTCFFQPVHVSGGSATRSQPAVSAMWTNPLEQIIYCTCHICPWRPGASAVASMRAGLCLISHSPSLIRSYSSNKFRSLQNHPPSSRLCSF